MSQHWGDERVQAFCSPSFESAQAKTIWIVAKSRLKFWRFCHVKNCTGRQSSTTVTLITVGLALVRVLMKKWSKSTTQKKRPQGVRLTPNEPEHDLCSISRHFCYSSVASGTAKCHQSCPDAPGKSPTLYVARPELTVGHILWPVTDLTRQWTDPWPRDPWPTWPIVSK